MFAAKSLVASIMRTCLLCDRPMEALKLYDDFIGSEQSIASEWQWGGKGDHPDPLCRDLAMQAMREQVGFSDLALELHRQTREEGVAVSREALLGVIGAFECDGKWREALSLVMSLLFSTEDIDRMVSATDMSVSGRIGKQHPSIIWQPNHHPWLSSIAASAMRTLNSTQNYGLSLFLCHLVKLKLARWSEGWELDRRIDDHRGSHGTQLEEALFSVLHHFDGGREIEFAVMDSLVGLGCHGNADNLFRMVQAASGDMTPDESSSSSTICERVQQDTSKREERLIGNSWRSADRHIQRLAAAIDIVQASGERLSAVERTKLDGALAGAMSACTDARQPETSLFLALWTINCLDQIGPIDATAIDRWVLSQDFLDRAESHSISDAVFAETINALRWRRGRGIQDSDAVRLFESWLATKKGDLYRWRLSCSAGISLLSAHESLDSAFGVFKGFDTSILSPDMFTVLAKGMSREERWAEIQELYHYAHDCGCLSEDLAVVTMRTVRLSATIKDKMRTLRSIVDDMAEMNGVDPVVWMETRYWVMRRALGVKYARLMMWWEDPSISYFGELDLAIQQFEQQRLLGLRAKHDLVRLIISSAKSFEEREVPDTAHGLSRVPKRSAEWCILLLSVFIETRHSPIRNDPQFTEDLNHALLKHGMGEERIQLIHESMENEEVGAIPTGANHESN